jgi:hypothetical protein
MTTQAVLVRGVPADEHARAMERAERSERTLSWVLRAAIREYGAGTWTPAERSWTPDERTEGKPRKRR